MMRVVVYYFRRLILPLKKLLTHSLTHPTAAFAEFTENHQCFTDGLSGQR